MKMHQFENIISIICYIITGFCLAMAIICIAEWQIVPEATICFIMSIAYLIIGICLQKGSQKDREYYIHQHESIKEIYEELSYMYKKYYWILDIDSTIPALKNKKDLLKWSTDVGLACLIYQHDYNTAKNDKQINQDLDIMINLIQELIDNKKYI